MFLNCKIGKWCLRVYVNVQNAWKYIGCLSYCSTWCVTLPSWFLLGRFVMCSDFGQVIQGRQGVSMPSSSKGQHENPKTSRSHTLVWISHLQCVTWHNIAKCCYWDVSLPSIRTFWCPSKKWWWGVSLPRVDSVPALLEWSLSCAETNSRPCSPIFSSLHSVWSMDLGIKIKSQHQGKLVVGMSVGCSKRHSAAKPEALIRERQTGVPQLGTSLEPSLPYPNVLQCVLIVLIVLIKPSFPSSLHPVHVLLLSFFMNPSFKVPLSN